MSTECPACGVAVIPGYVRCPKCSKPLPTTQRATTVASGTAMESGGVPVVPLVAGAVVIAIIAWLALRGGEPSATPSDAAVATDEDTIPIDPTEPSVTPNPGTTPPEGTTNRDRADLGAVVGQLRSSLSRLRLWGTVTAVGERIDLRSGACADPAMTQLLTEMTDEMREAGVAGVRCMEQSGRVVFDTDL